MGIIEIREVESWLGKKSTWKTNENIWWYPNNNKEENNALTKQNIIQQIRWVIVLKERLKSWFEKNQKVKSFR